MFLSAKRTMRTLAFLSVLVISSNQSFAADTELTIFAAASTTAPIMKIAEMYTAETGVKIKSSFASSGILCKQIKEGAEADIYISASKKWADYADENALLKDGTRQNFLTNNLVLIKPEGTPGIDGIEFSKDFNFPEKLTGRLSIGNPEHVPAGKYAKQSLDALDWWAELKGKLILSKNVQSALRVVEAAEAEYGIVYGSDAKKSDKVIIVGIFPEKTHKPIIYVISCVKNCKKGSEEFIDYIISEKGRKIFSEYGFIPLEK